MSALSLLTFKNDQSTLQWDTAGQERFRSMAPIYYRGSQAAVLLYDITNRDSFFDVRIWLDGTVVTLFHFNSYSRVVAELRRNMTSELVVHVVGAKADLSSQRQVPLEEARRLVQSWVEIEPPTPARSSSTTFEDSSLSPSLSMPKLSRSSSSRMGLSSLTLTGRSTRRQQLIEEEEGDKTVTMKPTWCQFDISEVSAKDDHGA